MQTVQRAEFWGAIIALQAHWPCHLGIDNLNVARNGGIRSLGVATGLSFDDGSNVVKRVRLTRKTHVGVPSVNIPDQGHLTPRRWKRLRPPLSEGVGG